MGKHYQLVVFDWEGTIAENGLGYVMIALTNAAQRLHLPAVDIEAARRASLYGLPHAVRTLFPTISLYQQEDLCNEIQKIMLNASATVALVAGIEKVIQDLHRSGMLLAIATNKSAQGLARVLHQSGLEPYIHMTRSATEAPPKPCPKMLEEIMLAMQCNAQQTLMVGDSASDMEMAEALGVDAIGMDFFQTEEQTLRAAGARDVFHDYEQLVEYIKEKK